MSILEKKRWVIKAALQLTKPDLIALLSMLINDNIDCIVENADGCRINLDRLNNHIIIKLYEYISKKKCPTTID
jgi:hypothetical protein